jgi:F-type H+-transporting ATPase subunit b
LKNPKARIATGKIEQDRSLAMKMLFDAVKRENVALPLEAAYRQQLVRVFSEVFGVDLGGDP